MRLITLALPIALCLVAVSGCHHSAAYLRTHSGSNSTTGKPCVDRAAYLAANTAAPLKTPEGLVAPNTKNSLKIGDVAASAPAQARTTSQGCLDKPPSFFGEKAKLPVTPGEKPVPVGKLAPKID